MPMAARRSAGTRASAPANGRAARAAARAELRRGGSGSGHSPAGPIAVTERARPAKASSSATQPPSELPATAKSSIPRAASPFADRLREPRRRGLGPPQRRRAAEPGQVDRDHLALLRQQRRHRRPDAAVGAERVQQHERGAGPRAVEGERRRDGGGRGHALATLRSGSRAGVAGRQSGLANSACASPMRCSAKPASQ